MTPATCRLFPIALSLALAPLFAAGCAAPEPTDAVSGGGSAISSTSSPVYGKISYANVRLNPDTNEITENAYIPGPVDKLQPVQFCHAYQDGTEEQKHACDSYPTNYYDMSCTTGFTPARPPDQAYESFTTCREGAVSSSDPTKPYTQGDGTYKVFFVNKLDPSDRKEDSVTIFADLFQLELAGPDLGYTQGFPAVGNYAITPGSATAVHGLHFTVQIKSELVDDVLGCATGFSTEGLTADEIAKKDAEQIELCKSPSAKINGRDGWTTRRGAYGNLTKLMTSDATALLRPNLHVVFAFSVNGHVRTYTFTT